MKIALNIMHLASRPPGALARVALCAAVLGGVGGAALAEPGAQDGPHWGRRDEAAQRAQAAQQYQPAPPAREAAPARRGPDNRGAEAHPADEPRHMAQGAEPGRRNARLTPDERRDLRRQINEAGQDLYATPPRR